MGMSLDGDAYAALADFRRFPAWMWRNRDVLEFVQWLRARNDAQRHPATKARFYGLDLYSLAASMEAVIRYLDAIDPARGPSGPRALRLLRPRRRRGRGLRLRPRLQGRSALRERGGRAAGGAPSSRRCVPTPRRLDRRRRALPRGTERARGTRRRGVLPADVPRRDVVVEPARPSHGGDPRRARRASRPPVRSRQDRRVGAQLACRRRACHGDGITRRAERRSARSPALRRPTVR